MKYNEILEAHFKYGTTRENIIKRYGYEEILDNVVLAPWWSHEIFKDKVLKIEKVSDKVIVNQNRKPRVFYGRFKFIQNYNTEQAVIYKSITNNYNFFNNNYFFINSITGVYYIFVFTTLSMFVFSKQFENLGNFDYFYIKEAIGIENKKTHHNHLTRIKRK